MAFFMMAYYNLSHAQEEGKSNGKIKTHSGGNVKREVRFRTLFGVVILMVLVIIGGTSYAAEKASAIPEVPVKGMVTMVDVGAKACIPCKMMAPIMEKMEKVYQGKAAIIFIDVWVNREQAPRFGVSTIPTQIFYDAKGKEVYRHVGFMSEEAIVAQLQKMGVK
jgi:thioredoxin 1